MEPEPDTKDWTWTLTRRCEQCGLAAGDVALTDVPERAFVAAEEWVAILRSSPAVNARPEPSVWSPLEYGAHVRDVFRLFDARTEQMLTEDEPTFANWDQDETAVAERYGEQDPEVVAEELEAAALSYVTRLRALTLEQRQRRGLRSNGSEFTVATLSQYFLHDVIHHLWDVTGQQDATTSLELSQDAPVLVVMGVSGTGKSTVAGMLADRLGWPLAEGDEMHPAANVEKMRAGTPLTDEDRWPWLDTIRDWIHGHLDAGTPGIITCSALRRVYRDRLRGPGVIFVHLAGTREEIVGQMSKRTGHFMPLSLLDSQLATLEPIESDEHAVVVSVAQPLADEVAEIVAELGLD